MHDQLASIAEELAQLATESALLTRRMANLTIRLADHFKSPNVSAPDDRGQSHEEFLGLLGQHGITSAIVHQYHYRYERDNAPVPDLSERYVQALRKNRLPIPAASIGFVVQNLADLKKMQTMMRPERAPWTARDYRRLVDMVISVKRSGRPLAWEVAFQLTDRREVFTAGQIRGAWHNRLCHMPKRKLEELLRPQQVAYVMRSQRPTVCADG